MLPPGAVVAAGLPGAGVGAGAASSVDKEGRALVPVLVAGGGVDGGADLLQPRIVKPTNKHALMNFIGFNDRTG